MASTGTLSINLFDGARNPWSGPEAKVVLTNPFVTTSDKKLIERIPKGKSTLILTNVKADAGQVYTLLLSADKHRDHVLFPVKPRAGAVTAINVMLIPKDPVPNFSGFTYQELQLKSPQFHDALSENITESVFKGLATSDKEFGLDRMASLLNIEAKLRATALKQGNAVEFIRGIQNLDCCERDRIKADVVDEMPGNVRGLKTFSELNPDLNEMNHKGFPISFKQKIAFCSLQLSFSKVPKNGLLSADIDIDLLTDIGHFAEVIRNKVTKLKTDPFTIYVLLFDQGIRPLYTLKV